MFNATAGIDIQVPIRCELDGNGVSGRAVTPDTSTFINIEINRSTDNVWETITVAGGDYTVAELGSSGDYNINILAVGLSSPVTPGFLRIKVSDGASAGATFKTEQYVFNIREKVSTILDGVVYADTASSFTGTSYPNGSASYPVKSLADAQSIANTNNISKILSGGVLADETVALSDRELVGVTGDDAKFKLLAGSTKSIIRNMNVVIESALTSGLIKFYNCKSFASNVLSKYSEYYDCTLSGSHDVNTPTDSIIKNSILNGFTLDATNIATATLKLDGCYGDLTIVNLNAVATINIAGFNGDITIDNTCLSGTINITGGAGKTTIGSSVTTTVNIDGVDSGSVSQVATLANQTTIIADIATVDTNVDGIKTKTDNLPADPASTTNVSAVETKVDTIDSIVDDILVDTTYLEKLAKNKHDIVKSAGEFYLIIYDDDDTTPLAQYKLEKFGGGTIGELVGTTTPSIRNKTSI